jgi:hypothetical protein
MKTIFDEIDAAAEEASPLFPVGNEEFIAKNSFKSGAKFVYDKCITIVNDLIIENQGLKLYKDNEGTRAIEFAEWINNNKEGYHPMYKEKSQIICYWGSSICGGRTDFTTEELYDKFLKENL